MTIDDETLQFELYQYSPLLPLNSVEFDRLQSASLVLIIVNATDADTGYIDNLPRRRDLPDLLSPDESAWEPLGSTRRKELLEIVITRVHPRWLTFRDVSVLAEPVSRLRGLQDYYVLSIVDTIRRKWDFENDRPKPRE